MRLITVIKQTKVYGVAALLALTSCVVIAQQSAAGKIPLVGNIVPTLIDNAPNPSRAGNVVKQALADYSVSIVATTQAWSGSGLRNGKFVGLIDHYSLNAQRNGFIYSEPYMELPLHIASRLAKAVDAVRLDKLYRTSLGVENRFANTDELRAERSVRWARSPDFLSNIKQLADRRVDYIIADKFMLQEFNKMLAGINRDRLYIAREPIYKVGLSLAINSDTPNAQKIVKEFDAAVILLKETGEYDKLLSLSSESLSLLDEALYEEILRKW